MPALTGNPQVSSSTACRRSTTTRPRWAEQMAADYGLHGGMEVTDEVFESAASVV